MLGETAFEGLGLEAAGVSRGPVVLGEAFLVYFGFGVAVGAFMFALPSRGPVVWGSVQETIKARPSSSRKVEMIDRFIGLGVRVEPAGRLGKAQAIKKNRQRSTPGPKLRKTGQRFSSGCPVKLAPADGFR